VSILLLARSFAIATLVGTGDVMMHETDRIQPIDQATAETLKVTRPSKRETVLARTFDAPRQLVFDALTQPDLLKRWYGPRGWSLVACDIDLKVGGAYRFVWRRPSGTEIAVQGEYREVRPPERFVRTESFVPAWPGGGIVSTTILIEDGGRTRVAITSLYESQKARDDDEKAAQHGATESFARLAELLAALR
jgi:uncharacterized protein YndB with AHSA1/START domain